MLKLETVKTVAILDKLINKHDVEGEAYIESARKNGLSFAF